MTLFWEIIRYSSLLESSGVYKSWRADAVYNAQVVRV